MNLQESRGLVTDKKNSFYQLGDAISEYFLDSKYGPIADENYSKKGICKFSLTDVKEYWYRVYNKEIEIPFWIQNLGIVVKKGKTLRGEFNWSHLDPDLGFISNSYITIIGDLSKETFPRIRAIVNHELRHAFDFYIDKIKLKRTIKNINFESLFDRSVISLEDAYKSKENLVKYYNFCLYLTIDTEMNAYLVSYQVNIKAGTMKSVDDSKIYRVYQDSRFFLENPRKIKPSDAAFVVLALKEEIEKYSKDPSMQVFKNLKNFSNREYLDLNQNSSEFTLKNAYNNFKEICKDLLNYAYNFNITSAGKERIYQTLERFNKILLMKVNKQLKRFAIIYYDLTHKEMEDQIERFQKKLNMMKSSNQSVDELISPFEDS